MTLKVSPDLNAGFNPSMPTIKETYFAFSSFFLSFSVPYMLVYMQKIVKVKKVGKVPLTETTASQNAFISISHFCTTYATWQIWHGGVH